MVIKSALTSTCYFVKNITNSISAEVFLWHPQQSQLRSSASTKQQHQSPTVLLLNIITLTNRWLVTA